MCPQKQGNYAEVMCYVSDAGSVPSLAWRAALYWPAAILTVLALSPGPAGQEATGLILLLMSGCIKMMRSFGKGVLKLCVRPDLGQRGKGGGLGGFLHHLHNSDTPLTVSIPFAISPNPPPPKLALSSYRHGRQRIFERSRGHAGGGGAISPLPRAVSCGNLKL